ncbi:hypothetical protein DDZ14_16810 [Maritimibacter sp. 55A14]|uniref:GNAT family N-acetyltransferase n=1 Tax=Maritimibacter sp. 55A14 TaxID=2174844 RepID=UPI000D6173A9|nr:hypothetical protein DDZ14_16810 [Maritimibacter sp. 55A14]
MGLAVYGRRFESHTWQKTLWLADLVVAENARGQGIGRLPLQAVGRRAQNPGRRAVVAYLRVCNASARAFYDRVVVRRNTEIEIRVIDLPQR